MHDLDVLQSFPSRQILGVTVFDEPNRVHRCLKAWKIVHHKTLYFKVVSGRQIFLNNTNSGTWLTYWIWKVVLSCQVLEMFAQYPDD